MLRAKGAAWTLPPDQLPGVADNIDRTGLFWMRPKPVQFQLKVGKGKYISIKRFGYQAAPADTRTGHAAQGETWDAVVGDLARPPGMEAAMHWLLVYVILSRCTSLEGFLAMRLPSLQELRIRNES